MYSFIFLALCLCYLLVKYFYTWFTNARQARLRHCSPCPRWPTWDPFFGTDFFLLHYRAWKENKLLATLHKQFDIVGTYTFSINMGGDHIIMTREPENVMQVLSVDADKYCFGNRRQDSFKALHGQGIFTVENKDWSSSRKSIRQALQQYKRNSLSKLEDHVQNLLYRLCATKVDLQTLFESFTLDTTTEFLWGQSTGCLTGKSDWSAGFDRTLFRAQEGTGARFNYGIFRYILTPKVYWKDVASVHDYIDTQLVNRNQEDKCTVLHRMKEQGYQPLRLRGELLQLLMAGRDTTAAMLSNAWFEMSRNPDVLEKLRREIDSLTELTPATILAMPYLSAIFHEVLRLYPPIPYNIREAKEDLILPRGGGPDSDLPIFVPKGSIVAWNLYSMHRLGLFGGDVENFRPDRWENIKPDWAFLPFSGGARRCVGEEHAFIEAGYVTIRILQEFRNLQRADDQGWEESLTLTCTNKTGVHVELSR